MLVVAQSNESTNFFIGKKLNELPTSLVTRPAPSTMRGVREGEQEAFVNAGAAASSSNPSSTEGAAAALATATRMRLLNESGAPLRCVAHIDLDGFYAAVERRRLGRAPDAMIAVQQWQMLIAVDYNCRKFGVKRGMLASEATKLCPGLECVHTELIAAPDADPNKVTRATHKVTLSRYRRASFEVMAVFQRYVDEVGGVLQRTSIDEAYIDCTAHCAAQVAAMRRDAREANQRVEHLFRDGSESESENESGARDADEGGALASVPVYEASELDALLGETCVIGELGCRVRSVRNGMASEADLRLAVAASLVNKIRAAVQCEVGFTVSAGIAHSKLLAKVASSRNKPNKQTLVPLCMGAVVLRSLAVRGIPGLGGKLGKRVAGAVLQNKKGHTRVGANSGEKEEEDEDEAMDAVTVGELQSLSEAQLRMALRNDETARWIVGIAHGIDGAVVEESMRPKSLLAMKSFPPERRASELCKWITLLSIEIVERIADDSHCFHRSPKTLTVHQSLVSRGSGGGRRSEAASASTAMPTVPRRLLHSAAVVVDAHERARRDALAASIVSAALTLVNRLNPEGCRVRAATRIGIAASNFADGPQVGAASIASFFGSDATAAGAGAAASAVAAAASSSSSSAASAVSSPPRRAAQEAFEYRAPKAIASPQTAIDSFFTAGGGSAGAATCEADSARVAATSFAAPPRRPSPPPLHRKGAASESVFDWECEACTLRNVVAAQACAACHTRRHLVKRARVNGTNRKGGRGSGGSIATFFEFSLVRKS